MAAPMWDDLHEKEAELADMRAETQAVKAALAVIERTAAPAVPVRARDEAAAGVRSENLEKAARYERTAVQAHDRALAASYRELARGLRDATK